MKRYPRVERRASRYLFSVPVRYRPVGHACWASGISIDLSRSGLLFEAAHEMIEGTELELILRFDETNDASVHSTGRVVRVTSDGGSGRLLVAATGRFAFVPGHAGQCIE